MERILMGAPVVFAAVTLLTYILIALKVPILIIPIVVLAIVFYWKTFWEEVRKIKVVFDKKTFIILAVFIVGIAGQLAIISPSGRIVDGNLVFWSSHAHDASWHIALTDEIQRGWPFQNPVFSGEKLVNYHFFSDIVPAVLNKYLRISSLDLYFRYLPLLYSLLFGTSAYFLAKKMTGSFWAGIWALMFSYFGGSFGYIATYIKDGSIGGESIFWASQPQSSSGNPPQIISNFLVLTFFYFVYSYIKNKDKRSLFASVLILGTLIEFKVYAAVVLLGATLLSGIWQVAFPAGIMAAALYFPNASGGTSFLIFQPWWYIRTMIVEPSKLDWLDLERRRQTYIYENNWKRVISIELSGFLMFFFGNLGMRFIGIWEYLKFAKSSLKNRFNLLFILTISASLVLPLLFLQKGVASNTSQFLQYFILLFGILAGITTANFIKVLKHPLYQIVAGILLILLMVPTQAALLYQFYSRTPVSKISAAELEALTFISQNSDRNAVILTPFPDPFFRIEGPTPNLWGWTDTAYVAAFSNRREYFSDKEQVDIMGYDYASREAQRKTIFESDNSMVVKEKIRETGVNLIYYPKGLSPETDFGDLGLNLFFENSDVEVWKTN
ncbi:hypothetical protein A2208_00250 [Candidatus Woesebacteria bacterium RIFOXYA1_FULL_43_16]|uniref:Glycosyltransferase RgtA/B/C/D-like domain-containing protein n=1 Tax=Candidatus Vogelbacteria bacterium RIFOXYD1_FULL_42_15 TaxID=1802437 RepID=A0A1G2QJS2_9BACT|nr:MAG: hypothetical protein A2208_00250 [Candidatus Woesebacteria bacterium RIFOXYA1_FULL_43_16]OHA60653.1 MAG: hypothetical protein A2607_01890 [Candidatus Vogelbacteria bacterium RIFOXYD1_FULL_42_15]